jgi:hypothetical protein
MKNVNKGGRPKKRNYRPRNPKHSRKLNRIVSQARALWPYMGQINQRFDFVLDNFKQ